MFLMLHNLTIDKKLFNDLIDDFATEYKNTGASKSIKLFIVGGCAIMMNFSYRLSTIDVDAFFTNNEKIDIAIKKVSLKRNIPEDWLNKEFINTHSYSEKIPEASKEKMSYFNGLVKVYVVQPKYLIAMKLKSSRPTGGDLDDVIKMIYEGRINHTIESYEEIIKAYDFLYESRNNTYDFFFNKAKEAFDTPIEEVKYLLDRYY